MKMPARVRPVTHFDDASFRPDEEGIEGGIDISMQMPAIAILLARRYLVYVGTYLADAGFPGG
jgi:hypothetical protein